LRGKALAIVMRTARNFQDLTPMQRLAAQKARPDTVN